MNAESTLINLLFLTLFWFAIIQVVVLLTKVISTRYRSIKLVKVVHTVAFYMMSTALLVMVYEVVLDRITWITWNAAGLFLAEGIVLLLNRGRCPMTSMAERLGASSGQITDLFLPKWFADQIFKVYGVLFVASLALLFIRLIR
jgi:hypothetical protein